MNPVIPPRPRHPADLFHHRPDPPLEKGRVKASTLEKAKARGKVFDHVPCRETLHVFRQPSRVSTVEGKDITIMNVVHPDNDPRVRDLNEVHVQTVQIPVPRLERIPPVLELRPLRLLIPSHNNHIPLPPSHTQLLINLIFPTPTLRNGKSTPFTFHSIPQCILMYK